MPTTDRHPHLRFVLVFVLLVLVAMCFPLLVKAEEPKFGGCLASRPDVCFSPAVSVNVVAMSLRDGSLQSTLDLGLGYGATFATSRWYRTGVAATVAFPTLEGARRALPALTFSFAEYARIGVACPLYVRGGFSQNGMLLLSFGSDFGRW